MEMKTDMMPPLVRALLDPLREGVLVFSPSGNLLYSNQAADLAVLAVGENGDVTRAILPKLARLGARITPIWVSGNKIGEAVYVLPSEDAEETLASQERQAITGMLEATGWKLTESARRLGISRTTLWRRLRAYGLERDSRGRWSKPS